MAPAMRHLAFLLILSASPVTCTYFRDCDAQLDKEKGPFGSPTFVNETWGKTLFWSLVPPGNDTLPLIVFMHGSTGQWEFYNENLELYASHGAVVVFPFIKNPEGDKKPFTLNTDGRYLVKAINYALNMTKNGSSAFFNRVDAHNIVIAGHSMGATCSIEASKTLLEEKAIKLTVAQHPGVCGPFGPPPLPSTWMPTALASVAKAHPVLFTTATNDGAFWPAPHTAEHEYGCFKKAMGGNKKNDTADITGKAAFIAFSADACNQDGDRQPIIKDGGHNCPTKFKNGGAPETPWVMTAFKLYAQFAGSKASKCYNMLWGDDADSLKNSKDADVVDLR